MTTKELLIDFAERLDEAEAAEALRLLTIRYGRNPAEERPLPRFVGMGHSGRNDLGRRAKEILRAKVL